METVKEPIHPRRLEKNANTTLESALLPQTVFTWWERCDFFSFCRAVVVDEALAVDR
jgi:hypothetical protein